jgi:hypothetical protein
MCFSYFRVVITVYAI